jgi:hypothetical protein
VRRLSHPPAAKTLELIRKEIETYALMFPHVAFTLDDTSKGFELGPSSSCRVMTVPKVQRSDAHEMPSESTLDCFNLGMFQASIWHCAGRGTPNRPASSMCNH